MKKVDAYLLSNGTVSIGEDKAFNDEMDILGEEIDGLIKLFNFEITRVHLQKSIIRVMNGNRAQLRVAINGILRSLDSIDYSEE